VPVEIVWSALARARLRDIRAYIARDKPNAAEKLATRIIVLVEALKEHPHLGRAGSEPGVRELIVGGTPYLILYKVVGKTVMISTIWHSAQAREKIR
jgi:addiction module RelE/StbE family toxin